MGTHPQVEPDDESEGSDDPRPSRGLGDANRVHITLENLADLANFDGSVLSGYGATNGRLGSPGRLDTPPGGVPEAGGPTIPAFPATPPMPPIPVDRTYESYEPYDSSDSWEALPALGNDARLAPPVDPGPPPPPPPPPPPAPGSADADTEQADGVAVRAGAGARIAGFYAGTSTRDPRAPDTGTHQTFYAGSSDPVPAPGGYTEFWGSSESLEVPAESPDAATEPVRRSAWARPAERWLLELMALAGASAALVAPSFTVVAVVVGVVVGASMAFVGSGRPLGTLPGRVLARSVRLLHPRSSLWLPVLLSRTILAAILLPAGVAALTWLDEHGRHGAMAAARAGAWDDGFRVFTALLCAMLLTSVGDGRRQRATAVRRWAAPATDGTLVILAVSCCAVLVLALTAVPHPVDPIVHRADGLGWLPPGARGKADSVRDDIATAELDSVASCISQRTDTDWRTSYTVNNPADDPDVARLIAPFDPPPVDISTAVIAAHNQLAPWVEAIEVEWRGQVLLRTERADMLRHRPVVDKDRLIFATQEGSAWLVVTELDVTLALRCSAGPVL